MCESDECILNKKYIQIFFRCEVLPLIYHYKYIINFMKLILC